ncbi:permease [Ornithinibacillus contaminans]|uniref:permease n=1 Tax=Ornithinibacillus contaminans TaxID=694055 RepID=UPI00064DA60A|nr:permease [Ornithinibacillus contaminans]
MAQANIASSWRANHRKTVIFALIFIIIAVAGLAYVKWVPYYHKADIARTTHSIGASILGDNTANASWKSAWDYAIVYFKSVWQAALLGILLGSLLQVLIPTNWLVRVLGKTSFGSTAIGGLASLPGMMCTCCAAPVAVGMRKKKASVGATLAFWLGNPALNPATLVFMMFVLSWKFTLIRFVAGLVIVFGVSYLANRFAPKLDTVEMDKMMEEAEQKEAGSFLKRWMRSMGMMVLYIVPAYVLSVLLLGAARTWLFPQMGDQAATGIIAICLFAIAGMLFVIPTAAEIPIIQTFMAFGLGGGPAAALLITLPTISLPSLLMVGKSFPKRVLFFVAAAVVLVGILSGIVGMFFL